MLVSHETEKDLRLLTDHPAEDRRFGNAMVLEVLGKLNSSGPHQNRSTSIVYGRASALSLAQDMSPVNPETEFQTDVAVELGVLILRASLLLILLFECRDHKSIPA
ncbi:protein kinase domain-containing protein [Anopheles sinensis]|uniref:Protein kinase domain-containing protein n=1 Tax=Anopheles sinensis TaxID=74873 RepID=A0A084WPF0_ANOSI|nr:protein kinase domain-containing protein [Anopheles sinensis]